jgi:hypothetical protein
VQGSQVDYTSGVATSPLFRQVGATLDSGFFTRNKSPLLGEHFWANQRPKFFFGSGLRVLSKKKKNFNVIFIIQAPGVKVSGAIIFI